MLAARLTRLLTVVATLALAWPFPATAQNQSAPDKSGGDPNAQDEVNNDKGTGAGEGTKGDPVEISTGAFCYSKDLFDIPGRDLNLKLALGYISNAQGIETQTGPRWTHSYEEKLVIKIRFEDIETYEGPMDPTEYFYQLAEDLGKNVEDVVLENHIIEVYHMHDLRVDFFSRGTDTTLSSGKILTDWEPHDAQLVKLKSEGHYSTIPGTGINYLVPESFTLRYPDGHKTVFPLSNLEGGCGIFTIRAGQQIDRNGNTLTYSYNTKTKPSGCTLYGTTFYYQLDTVTDDLGNYLDFDYDSNEWLNAITAVTGTTSRVVSLAHDSAGNITSITTPTVTVTPPDTSALNYSARTELEYVTYNSSYPHSLHNIARIYAPNEVAYAAAHMTSAVPYVENTWDTTCERVLSQFVGGTNESGIPSGGTYAFLYETISPTTYAGSYSRTLTGFDPSFQCKYRTLSVDPDRHVQLHCFDENYRECLVYTFTGGLDPTSIGGGSISSLVSITAADPSTSDHITNPSRTALGSMAATCLYTLTAYNGLNLPVAVYTADSRTTNVYDNGTLQLDRFQWGNLLWSRQVSNASPADTIDHAYLYEPFYNQVRVAYDPRAFGSYTPPNGGTHSADRYSVQTAFDYQTSGPSSFITSEASYWGIDLSQSTALGVLSALSPPAFTMGTGGSPSSGNAVGTSRTVRVYNNALAAPPTFTTLTETSAVEYNSYGLPTVMTDAGGFKTRFTYYTDSAGSRVIGTDSDSASNGGFLATVTRAIDLSESETVTTAYGYDEVGHVNVIRNPRGFETAIEYDEMDRAVTTTDALGTARGTLYDQNGNELEHIAAFSEPTMDGSTGYPTGSMTSVRYIRTTMKYDILDNVIERQVQNGPSATPSVVKYRYTRAGARVLTLYPEWGNESKNVEASVFDELGRPYTNTHGGITTRFAGLPANADIPELSSIPVDVTGVTATTKTLYLLGTVQHTLDEEGHVSDYEYDGFNRLLKTTDPEGNYTARVLDKAGNVVESSAYDSGSVLLAQSTMSVDERNQVFQTEAIHKDQGGTDVGDGAATTRTIYDVRGLVATKIDDAGDCWYSDFDGLGRVTTTEDPAQNVMSYGYDSNSNLIYSESTEPETDSPTTTHTQRSWKFHDELDRVRVAVDELGHAIRTLYDTEGRVVYQSDARASAVNVSLASLDSGTHPQHGSLSGGPTVNAEGNTTWYAYDDAGYLLETRVHQRVDGLGGNALLSAGAKEILSSRSYDLNGLLRTQTDDSGNVTAYHYDSLNRLDSTTYANTVVDTRSYYRTGVLKSTTDGNGTTIDYTYDANNRPTQADITRGTGVYGPTQLNYAYDGLSRLTLATTPSWTVERAYDTLSQLVEETANGETTAIGRDSVGRLTGYQYPGGRQIQVSEDAIGRLRWVKNTGGSTISTLEYRDATSIKSRSLVNGTTSSYLYDDIKRVTETAHVSGSSYIDHRQYAWDRQSNKTSRTDLLHASTRVLNYAYDSAARMTSSVRVENSSTIETIPYRLDDVGNRRQVNGGPDIGRYTLNTTDLPVNLYTATPFDSRTYDANQNLGTRTIGSDTVTINYDYANRIIQWYDSGTSMQHLYEYDALGRRVTKTIDNGGAGETITHYYYDGGWRVVEEQDEQAATLATYVYEQGIDDVISMRRASADYYYHADDMANVTVLTDSGGAAVEEYEYRDYGEVVTPATFAALFASSIGNSRLFNGRELDWEIGLYYYRSRYMDPRAGRFVSRDPLGVWGDSGNVGNATAYCGNNPWSRIDPLGLAWSQMRGNIGGSHSGGTNLKGNTGGSHSGGRGLKGDIRSSKAGYRNLRGNTWHKGSAWGGEKKARNGGNGPSAFMGISVTGEVHSTEGKCGRRIPGSRYYSNEDGDELAEGCDVCEDIPVQSGAERQYQDLQRALLLVEETKKKAEALHRYRNHVLNGQLTAEWIDYSRAYFAEFGIYHPMDSVFWPQQGYVSSALFDISWFVPGSMLAGGVMRFPRNFRFAGGVHPRTNIPFNAKGFPIFKSVAKAEVKITQTGNRAIDANAANQAMGWSRTPEGFVWHHHEDLATMQLVPAHIHAATGHSGGVAVLGQ